MANSLTLSNRGAQRHKAGRGGFVRRVSGFLAVLVALGIAVAVGEYFVATPVSEASTGAMAPAAFSGEFADGVPVYRLQPITVVARRDREASR